MNRYNTKTPLGSYTISTQLVRQLTEFLSYSLPKMLSTDFIALPVTESTAITLFYSDRAIRYPTLRDYHNDPFTGDLEGLDMELAWLVKFDDATKAIVLHLAFNKEKDHNFLHMALQDTNADIALKTIEEQLLSILEKHKNSHRLIYRSEWFPPILFLAGGALGSLTFLMHTQPWRSLFAIGFGLCVYLFAYPYFKGYSSFESRRQRQWNTIFQWFTAGVAGSILAVLLFF
ncbi:MAG: hypothetical protein JST68_14700 [Bacteroidetes bacterium]|nr:hypothetical protein [Bacteroidota bacterium]